MNLSAGVQLPLFRYVFVSGLVILLLMFAEWAISTGLPRDAQAIGSLARVFLLTILVGIVGYLSFRRQQRLAERLAVMLAHQEKLNGQYLQELSEREATQRTLSEQLQFLQVLIDAIPAPIFYKDAEGIYSGCNRAFEAFLGKPRNEIIGRSVYGVSPGPQAQIYHQKDIDLMRQRGHQVYESSVVYADGTLHDVIFNKASYETKDGQLGGLIGVILDITERKSLERELVEAKETAEFCSRSKTRFLTNMSHEIRTPLNAIVGFSQVLLNRSSGVELPANFQNFLKKIAVSGQGLAKLVNDVLDISRIEAGKFEAVNEDFQLRGLVENILTSCEPQATSQRLSFCCDIDPSLPEFIRIDRGKLSQILINLISNAIKFSPANTVVDLKLQKLEGNKISFEVIDRGIGIPPEQQAIVFEPFEQVRKPSYGQSQGAGLGLPITRGLVELLGGEISFESEENISTRFRVILPLVEGCPVEQLPAHISEPCEALRGARVVIFEDNALNQTLMQAFCDDLEMNATFVADGREGIKIAAKIQPDIIFMDVQLRGINGIEATEQIRQIPEICKIPIIGLSAAAFSEQHSAALNAGMDDYLTKPIAFPQLISVINKHLS